jgi:hypothetical protein
MPKSAQDRYAVDYNPRDRQITGRDFAAGAGICIALIAAVFMMDWLPSAASDPMPARSALLLSSAPHMNSPRLPGYPVAGSCHDDLHAVAGTPDCCGAGGPRKT